MLSGCSAQSVAFRICEQDPGSDIETIVAQLLKNDFAQVLQLTTGLPQQRCGVSELLPILRLVRESLITRMPPLTPGGRCATAPIGACHSPGG
jgi:hypothetical protein